MSIAESTRPRAARRALRRLAATGAAFFCTLWAVRAARAAGPAVVSLEFDDSMADCYTARPILASHGMKATFFANSGRLGDSGSLTVAQLHDLANDGHEIGGHTLTHLDLPTLSYDDALTQICDDRTALIAMGFPVSSFAYPFGNLDATTQSIVSGCGYDSGRDIGGLKTQGGCPNCPYAESIPPADPFATRSHTSVKETTSLATMKGYVTEAENNGGGWVQLVFHHVCDGCDTYSVSPARLTALLDWLAVERTAGRVVVKTVAEVMGGGTPLPNLLKNTSFERDADANGTADCWEHGARGTNTAQWARLVRGHTGVAESVRITSFTNGERTLMSRQDAGVCAPAVTQGHRYTVSAWYTSTAKPRFVAYSHSTGGGWTWWRNSVALTPQGAWTKATWTLPPVPAGVTLLSVGLELPSLGTLSVDDMTLVDATP